MGDDSAIVEHVARAMCFAVMVDPDWIDLPLSSNGSVGIPHWRYKEPLARAALKASGHAEMIEALREAQLQIEYLHEKIKTTATGETTLFKIRSALVKASPTPRKVPDPTGSER